jgi:hypothetical protein
VILIFLIFFFFLDSSGKWVPTLVDQVGIPLYWEPPAQIGYPKSAGCCEHVLTGAHPSCLLEKNVRRGRAGGAGAHWCDMGVDFISCTAFLGVNQKKVAIRSTSTP